MLEKKEHKFRINGVCGIKNKTTWFYLHHVTLAQEVKNLM